MFDFEELMDDLITGWIARAIIQHNPKMTIGLAQSRPYRINPKTIDQALNTIPLQNKPVFSNN